MNPINGSRATERERMRVAETADLRGRAVSGDASKLRRHIVDHGTAGLMEVLFSRQNQRWENLRETSQFLTAGALLPLRRIPYLDWLMATTNKALGVVEPGEDSTFAMLRDGIDEMLAYSRHAMMLGPVAAAVLARHQIERWASNILYSMGKKPVSETPTPAEISEAYQPTKFNMVRVWSILSDVIHGRGEIIDLTVWDSAHCATYEDRWLELSGVFSATSVALSRVLLWIEQALTLYVKEDLMCPAVVPPEHPGDVEPNLSVYPPSVQHALLFQLDPFTLRTPILDLARDAPAEYSGRLLEETCWPPKNGGQELLMFAFASRRGSAVNRALFALESERIHLGDRYDESVLYSKDVRKVAVCETAGLIALHSAKKGAPYLAHAASALRSAFVLWLEDDSQSMACVRAAIEALAKARAWRLKPPRATQLEAWGAAPAGRWLDLAGLKRLKPLYSRVNRFGHFVLTDTTSKIGGLTDLFEGGQTESDPIQVARGTIRRSVEDLFAIEVSEWLKTELPELADAFWEAYGVKDALNYRRGVEQWMNHVWAQREGNSREA